MVKISNDHLIKKKINNFQFYCVNFQLLRLINFRYSGNNTVKFFPFLFLYFGALPEGRNCPGKLNCLFLFDL